MTETTDYIRGIQLEILKDLKDRRRLLDSSISRLEYELAHPSPSIKLDYEEIELEAEWLKVFIDQSLSSSHERIKLDGRT